MNAATARHGVVAALDRVYRAENMGTPVPNLSRMGSYAANMLTTLELREWPRMGDKRPLVFNYFWFESMG